MQMWKRILQCFVLIDFIKKSIENKQFLGKTLHTLREQNLPWKIMNFISLIEGDDENTGKSEAGYFCKMRWYGFIIMVVFSTYRSTHTVTLMESPKYLYNGLIFSRLCFRSWRRHRELASRELDCTGQQPKHSHLHQGPRYGKL